MVEQNGIRDGVHVYQASGAIGAALPNQTNWLISEWYELVQKLDRLNELLESVDYGSHDLAPSSSKERVILIRQQACMRGYALALGERISAHLGLQNAPNL